jgi:uncharacterized protein YbaA (DUF1428 family)
LAREANFTQIEDVKGEPMKYVDGFVLAVPEKNLADYRKMATAAGKVWRKHGALEYVEAVADDLEVKFGLSFKKLAKRKRGETVVFSWIVFKSRAHRDQVKRKSWLIRV